ncbi:hypothetical protein GCM10020216_062310 [Nonomuraea helvata]
MLLSNYGISNGLTGYTFALRGGLRKEPLKPAAARARTVPVVDPGTSITVGFPLPGAVLITARARFTADGRPHDFRVRAGGPRGRGPASPARRARPTSPAAPTATRRPQA